jgi:hypothetical protein
MSSSKPRHDQPIAFVETNELGERVVRATRQFQQFLDELDSNISLSISFGESESQLNSAYLAKLQNQIGSGDPLTWDDTGFTWDSTKHSFDQTEA